MPTITDTLVVDDLGRDYHTRSGVLTALDGVSFSLRRGEVLTILGPNGAGKTTLMKIVATLLTPSRGSVRVEGIDVAAHPRAARARLGLVLGGDRGFYPRASARENLEYFASIAGVPWKQRRTRINALLDRVGLAARAGDRVEAYSRGMRQRLHIARGLLAEPPLLLLDEPTIGLDPESALSIRGLVNSLRADGRSLLVTTHYLHEAERLSNQSIVIVDGRLRARGTAEQIAAQGGLMSVTSFSTATLPDAVLAGIRAIPGVHGVIIDELRGQFVVAIGWAVHGRNVHLVADLIRPLDTSEPVTRPASLEEGYLALLGRVESALS